VQTNDIVTVAAVTSYRDTPTVDQCYAVGMEDVLLKPVCQDDLEVFIFNYYKKDDNENGG